MIFQTHSSSADEDFLICLNVLLKACEEKFIEINRRINKIFISARRLDVHYYPKLGHEPIRDQAAFDKFIADMEDAEKIVFWHGEDDAFELESTKFIKEFIDTINVLSEKRCLL